MDTPIGPSYSARLFDAQVLMGPLFRDSQPKAYIKERLAA